jgi:hypothetical protein
MQSSAAASALTARQRTDAARVWNSFWDSSAEDATIAEEDLVKTTGINLETSGRTRLLRLNRRHAMPRSPRHPVRMPQRRIDPRLARSAVASLVAIPIWALLAWLGQEPLPSLVFMVSGVYWWSTNRQSIRRP